jgi:hypothetical protein
MQTFFTKNRNDMDYQIFFEKLMTGATEMDDYILHVLAHSHQVCIVNLDVNLNVKQIYNTKGFENLIYLKEYCCSKETNIVSKKRTRTDDTQELTPTKVEKKTKEGGIKSEQKIQTIKGLFTHNIQFSYNNARKEIDSLVFTDLNVELNCNTIIGSFQKAQRLKNVGKFEFYTELKNTYLKEYIACWDACVYEMKKFSNSLKVQEHINNHMIAVESILYTYLNDLLKKPFAEAMNKKKGKTEHFSKKLEETSIEIIKEKLTLLLSDYIKGFLDILPEN